MWEFSTCEAPFASNPGLIADIVLRGVRPRILSPLPEGFPADYFALMQKCWLDNAAQSPTAEHVHSRLLKMYPSARAVQGALTLRHPVCTHAPASLLHCILAGMQAGPGQRNAHLAPIVQAMVADAAQIVCRSAKVKQHMQHHQVTEMEAQTVSAYTIDARDHSGLREHSIFFMKWNEMKWNGMEWNGMEWNGMEWNGMEWNGMEWNEMKWNGMEWNGMEWNGMEWNGMEWNEMK
jgi:hypothetical protein